MDSRSLYGTAILLAMTTPQSSSAPSRLLTVAELAARLNVPPRWVYAASAQGRLPVVRVGRLLRFDPADIDRWLASHRDEPVDV